MIWIYRLLFPFFIVLASPYYLLRMRRRGGYGSDFSQRFGSYKGLPPRKPGVRRVWLQAVSVGEMLAVEPILKALKSDGTEVVLTTTTSTGRKLAAEKLAAHVSAIAYFPIDWMPFSSAAWEAIRPDLAIITEGERWPEHMRQAAARKVPVLCINARLSDRSYQRMSVWPAASRFLLSGITRLLAGSEQDAERFGALGFPKGRITVTGNIKLDVDIPRLDQAARERLRAELGLPRASLVLLGSSTWPGEEEALLETLKTARGRGTACSLLIVPRHAERRAEVERVVKASGFSYHLRSQGAAPAEVDVAVADTTGELRALTQLADLVFVGKSLVPHREGQTPVEAATLGKPILLGPGMANFRAIEADLLHRGAARTVASPAELATKASALLADKADRDSIAAAGGAWRRDNGGGVERTLLAIRSELGRQAA
ncbi:MAG TPA: glycosyltransferase N-terminal domain-containing protein [Opitutaceae bacterium]|jgi:3-deoxy-D-manno-octulosonic-acid transferase|nr:glycosyltransferase N-terminal domain-containing protein [Opitutaceae bacterium]